MVIKSELRKSAIELLKNISTDRKKAASEALFKKIIPLIKEEKKVISFYPLSYEIDCKNLNQELIKQNKLVLPRVNDKNLDFYEVNDISTLKQTRFGIFEPEANFQKKLVYNQISLIIIPGLLFDKFNYRLGHGYGCWDRFLKNKHYHIIGVGFKEQLYTPFLPIEPHDIALSEVYLF